MLYNLQILRGIAALSVVFYHTDFRVSGGHHTQFFGVPIFFVISGFIMCYITRDNPTNFLRNRAIRIVPMYWLCTLALVLITFKLPIELISGTLPADLLKSLLFLPSEEHPVLGVGWTLNYEIYFYLVFGAALWLDTRYAPLITAGALSLVFALDLILDDIFLLHFYSNTCIYYFIAGIAIYYAFTLSTRPPLLLTTIVGVSAIAACYGCEFFDFTRWGSFAPILIVASALFLEKSGAFISARWLTILGDASYAIYLSHPILIRILYSHLKQFTWGSPKDNAWVMIGYVASSAVVGILIHLYLERPMLKFFRDRAARRSLRSLGVSMAQ